MVDKLVEECAENIDEVKITEITLAENIHKCSSCTLHNVVFNNLCNQHWNCYLFSLLQIHEG